ncbi:hypothetical protein QZH41_007756 [Actinostola sp. cb2023]|nr:hypothetical protein QZH41_007756 [Actinostola sp. cb2023]
MNNTTTACFYVSCQFSKAEIVLIVTAAFIIIAAAVIGNISTVIVVISSKKFRSISNLSTLNLALSDILLAIFVAPLVIVNLYLTENWVFGAFFCKLYNFIRDTSVMAALLNLFVVSIERFVAVCFPFYLRTRKRAFVYCVPLVWILAMAIASPTIKYNKHIVTSSYTICYSVAPEDYGIVNAIIVFALLLMMIPMQMATICKLRMKGTALKYSSHSNYIRRRNACYILFVLMLSCLVCWTPGYAMRMSLRFNKDSFLKKDLQVANRLYVFIVLLFFSCPVIHSIIFFFLSPKGKRTIKNVMNYTRKRNSPQSSKTSDSSRKRTTWPFSGLSIRGSSLLTKESAF